MDTLFIFGAKYLYLASAIAALSYFFRSSKETRKGLLVFALISFGLAFVISIIAREMYFNPRPFVVGGFEPLVAHEADNGFPSDHTLLVAAIASLMIFFNKKLSFDLWLNAIVVGISRVYVGVHHPLDVLASTVIALVSALIAYAIIHKLWNKPNKTNS